MGWKTGLTFCILFVSSLTTSLPSVAQIRTAPNAGAPAIQPAINPDGCRKFDYTEQTNWIDLDGTWNGEWFDRDSRRWKMSVQLSTSGDRISGKGTVVVPPKPGRCVGLCAMFSDDGKEKTVPVEFSAQYCRHPTTRWFKATITIDQARDVQTMNGIARNAWATSSGRELVLLMGGERTPGTVDGVRNATEFSFTREGPIPAAVLHPWASDGVTQAELQARKEQEQNQTMAAYRDRLLASCEADYAAARSPEDYRRALLNCEMVAGQSIFPAYYFVGQIKERGLHGEEDLRGARIAYNALAQANDVRGQEALKRVEQIIPVRRVALRQDAEAALRRGDFERAEQLAREARWLGDKAASGLIAQLYKDGRGGKGQDAEWVARAKDSWASEAALDGIEPFLSEVLARKRADLKKLEQEWPREIENCRTKPYNVTVNRRTGLPMHGGLPPLINQCISNVDSINSQLRHGWNETIRVLEKLVAERGRN